MSTEQIEARTEERTEDQTTVQISNPYWEEVSTWPRDEYDGDIDCYPDPPDFPRRRKAMVTRYSWAIPSPSSIAFILERLGGRPVIEIGAGTGYWLWLLAQHGIDVRGYDKAPPRRGQNSYHCQYAKVSRRLTDEEYATTMAAAEVWREGVRIIDELIEQGVGNDLPRLTIPELPQRNDVVEYSDPDGNPGPEYVHIISGGPEALHRQKNQGRVLLLSWPPYDTAMGSKVLSAYHGDDLFYIGEGRGGCTGDDEMHEILASQWELVDMCRQHENWSGIHDRLRYYRRRTQPMTEGETA